MAVLSEETVMLKHAMISGILVLGLSVPAYAGTCPVLSKKVMEALAKSTLPADKNADIKKLRDKGDMLHRTGKHRESVATLKEGMSMLGTYPVAAILACLSLS